jgi:hypothetical protein
MYKEGLHLYCGVEGRVLCMIVEDKLQTHWVREFAIPHDAEGILAGDFLTLDEAARATKVLSSGTFGFFTTNYTEPVDGYESCAFRRFIHKER